MATLVCVKESFSYGTFFSIRFIDNNFPKVWNDELAKLAEYNVLSCIFEHDECRNTSKYLEFFFSFNSINDHFCPGFSQHFRI